MDFIDLKVILDTHWDIFKSHFEQVHQSEEVSKRNFLEEFERIYRLRNQCMHPLKKKGLDAEDFNHLQNFCKKIDRFIA